MKRRDLAIGLSTLAATAACTADPATTERARPQDTLQGTWRAVEAQRDGAPARDLLGHELTFTGDRFRITSEGRLVFGGTWSADAALAPPRIEFVQTEGAELRGTWKGIYRLDGGRLEIVDNAAEVSRPAPTTFATAPGSGHVLVRFERR